MKTHYSLLSYKTKCVTVYCLSVSLFRPTHFVIKDQCQSTERTEETLTTTLPHQQAGESLRLSEFCFPVFKHVEITKHFVTLLSD